MFVPEGTDPDGPSGMQQIYHVEGGKPDAYLDIDTVEETPVISFWHESSGPSLQDS